MNRRHLLAGLGGAAAAIITPEAALAAAQFVAAGSLDWSLGFADLDQDLAPRRMRLVSGRPPSGLSGSLYRNGPGKFRRPGGAADHWFDGDGLVRAFRVADGQASLAARFVDTPKRRTDTAANAVVTPGFGTPARPGARVGDNDDTNAGNISVMPIGDEVWALWEAGSPIALNARDLSTKGIKTLRPDLAHVPFLAHPRFDPGGDIWSLGVQGDKALVWRLGRDGGLKAADLIDLPQASYVHDFTLTQRHLILVLQPWIQDRMTLPYGESFNWRPDEGVKVLVLDKADLTRRRLYELPAFFAFHFGAGWEEADGTLRFDACVSPTPGFVMGNGRSVLKGVWTPEPSTRLILVSLSPDGRARTEATGMTAEFPRSDPRRTGLPRRFSIHATGPDGGGPLFQALAVHDWKTGRSDAFDFGRSHLVEEAVFAPRPGGSDELDGWLIGPSVNLKARATELHVFDARRVADGPVCTWRADALLPVSLHGVFVGA